APVVADDELVPEARERDEPRHARAPAGAARRPRSARTAANDASARKARIAGSAASSPGHDAPAPSVAQNVPNVVSSSPTVNFSVFSGTRLSGARTMTPTPTTTTNAAAAAAAASATP